MSRDVGFLPFGTAVVEHSACIFDQESAMPRLLIASDSVLASHGLEDIGHKVADETDIKCNDMVSSIAHREPAEYIHVAENKHNFPRIDIDLNQKIVSDEKLKAGETDEEPVLLTVTMQKPVCMPHDMGISRRNPEICFPHDNTAQIGELLETEMTLGNQMECADKMITLFTDHKATEVEIPINSMLAEPAIAQKLPINSFSEQKPLLNDALTLGLQVLSDLYDNKPISPSKQHGPDKKDEKYIFKKQKSKRSRNNNAPTKEHRADSMPKFNKVSSGLLQVNLLIVYRMWV